MSASQWFYGLLVAAAAIAWDAGFIPLDQLAIATFGVAAVALSQDADPKVSRWACLFGMAGQPAWFWATWQAGQLGIFALSFLYTLAWARGAWTYWIAPRMARQQ